MRGLFPECDRRGCSWAIRDDILRVNKIVTHGKGEAMMEIDVFTAVTEPVPKGLTFEQRVAWRDTAIVRRMAAWFEEVHAYEDRNRPAARIQAATHTGGQGAASEGEGR